VDWFLNNWQRCPTLAEFKAETVNERNRMTVAAQRDRTNACANCESGFVIVNWEKWIAHPCEACRPEQFDRWQRGEYRPT
tara:strand:- start:967 stop:1206 length:240 start_codon:yes stop_codon:yes gene_type:complete